MASIQGVYLALFGRPADPLGLSFFNTATSNGANLTAIGDLASTAEYQDRFKGQSNSQIITSIYQSLFNREPDLAGLTFFADALANKTLTINNIAIAIFDGAKGDDVKIRDLKVDAADAFTKAIDTVAEINGYNGNAALASARAFIDGVKTDAPSADQITTAVNTAVAAGAGGAGTAGLTFTLTDKTDNFDPNSASAANKTTAGDDLFRGLNAGDLTSADAINGGGGVDALRALAPALAPNSGAGGAGTDATAAVAGAGGAADTPAANGAAGAAGTATTTTFAPVLTSVEKVFINATVVGGAGGAGGKGAADVTGGAGGAGADNKVVFDVSSSTGITELWSEGSTTTRGANGARGADNGGTGGTGGTGGNASLEFTGISLATVVGVKDSSAAHTFTFAGNTGSSDSATLALSKSGVGTNVIMDGIEIINIRSTGATNSLILNGSAASAVNVTGDKILNLNLNALAGTIKTIDTTGSSAASNVTLNAALSESINVKMGAAADTISLTDAAKSYTLDLGAGADTAIVDFVRGGSITTGAGADTIYVRADSGAINAQLLTADAVTTAAKLGSAVLTVTDFTSGSDKINIDAVAPKIDVLTGTQLATVAASANLLAATNAALAATGAAAKTIAFQYGSDTYLVVNNDGDQRLSAGDALIKLVGVTSLAASDFAVS